MNTVTIHDHGDIEVSIRIDSKECFGIIFDNTHHDLCFTYVVFVRVQSLEEA